MLFILHDIYETNLTASSVQTVHIGKMAAATLSFRWLEILEKEFDKAFVDLDLLLGEIDPDQCEITYEGRQKMTALSAAFAQLCHKAQTIFQSNAKLEVRMSSADGLFTLVDDIVWAESGVFRCDHVYRCVTKMCWVSVFAC